MHIELIGKKQHYSLDFEGKFNVISGLSGSKKTAFVKLLNKYKQGACFYKIHDFFVFKHNFTSYGNM